MAMPRTSAAVARVVGFLMTVSVCAQRLVPED
jgi:hypothetical protein